MKTRKDWSVSWPWGGWTTLHSSEQSVYVPRSTALGVDGWLRSPMILAAATVRWRGTLETRTRTVIVMTTGEGRWWRRAAPLGIPEAPDSSSSDEGLPDEDHEESASSSDNASSEEGWNSDSEAEEAADRDSREGFNLPVAALNVRGYGRKKTEVQATATRYPVDALALTETRSRRQGQVEGEDYDLWESGAKRAEGKALLVHAGGHLTAIPEEVTEDVFVLLVQYWGKDLVRIGVVYATPDRPARQVLDGLREVISSTPPPLILLGDYNKDALRRPDFRDQVPTWGYTTHPTRWTWTWRGAGAHAQERSMLDFVMTPAGVAVGHVQVLGHIPVRTDHRMVVADIRVPGTFREAPLGAQPRPAQTRHQQIAPEQWQKFRTEHDQWAQRWEPDPILPRQQWMEATMEMLVRAVGAPAHEMGARVEAHEWGALMARKRRWLARARFQEQQSERLDQGPPDLGAARR